MGGLLTPCMDTYMFPVRRDPPATRKHEKPTPPTDNNPPIYLIEDERYMGGGRQPQPQTEPIGANNGNTHNDATEPRHERSQ